MQGDDPPFLTVGTDVSAKYKGAFCEAKIKKVVRNIKCKVSLKSGGSITVNDDQIKGNLHVGNTVEVKTDPKKDSIEAVITKMQDCSQYTVVFDDGDITTLRRTALCLKSGRHFNESETLDQLPLTHPEHFSTPVIAGRRGRRGRALSEESEPETRRRPVEGEREPHAGRVVLVETSSGSDRRKPNQAAFPALVVAPTAQDTVKIKVKEDYLVRSFKDGRYYTVPKKEAREFRKGSAPSEWGGVEAALQYLNNGVLPPHWDRDALFNEPSNVSDDSSDDEPREEKDHFVAQLFKFMDDRGTPLNRNPTIANRDIDLYRLFSGVQKLGGYNRVTNQNQWKVVAGKMGFQPATATVTNQCKQSYKKFLHDFEDFYRKLGVTLVAHPRGARTPPTGRSLIRDRDKLVAATPTQPAQQTPSTSKAKEDEKPPKTEKKETKEAKIEMKEEKAKSEVSDEDSADNQPLAAPPPVKIEKEEKSKEKEKEKPPEEKERSMKSRSSVTSIKRESMERRNSKLRRPPCNKSGDSSGGGVRSSRRPHASTDSDSSGRASRCGVLKKTPTRRSQSANSASSGNTIASSNSNKRPRKRTATERISPTDSPRGTLSSGNINADVGDKLKVYYGPNQSESKVTYDAKVTEISPEGLLRVHYTGWNTRYDEWIKPQRIALNVTQHERTRSKTDGKNRRSRTSRLQQERQSESDSDSDSDSEDDIKRPPKRIEEKTDKVTLPPTKESISATPPPRKVSTSEENTPTMGDRCRKRTMRSAASVTSTASTSTSNTSSPPKKLRTLASSHQGRDYDLNEIRSELKGLHTVKTEPEEIKQEIIEKTPPRLEPIEEPKQEKPDDDVYEFKEPEPFEFELHDEKKKRTHRIFDDVSPKYSMKSIIDDMNEEIRSRPCPRASSLSPFHDFTRDMGRRTPDNDQDDIFSLDGDLAGEATLGPDFEGFTPAKNQETYSKKARISRILPKEILEEPPDSPEDDPSTDDEQIEALNKEDSNLPPLAIEPCTEPEGPLELDEGINKSKAESTIDKIEEPRNILRDIKFRSSPLPPITEPTDTTNLSKQEVKKYVVKEECNIAKEQTKLDRDTNDKEKSKVEKEKSKLDKEKNKSEKEKSKSEKSKSEKEKPKLEKDKSKPDKDKPKQEKEKLLTEKEKSIPEKDKVKDDAEKPKVDKDTQKCEKEDSNSRKFTVLKEDSIECNVMPPKNSLQKQNIVESEPHETKKIEDLKVPLTDTIRSALIDTEESKSEPDSPSPARMEELIPEPPPAFLLNSEGPKIAEKLLKAINSAKKRISTSPPREEIHKTPKRDFSKVQIDLFKSTREPLPKPPSQEISKKPSVSPTGAVRSNIRTEPPKHSAKVDTVKISKPDPTKSKADLKIEIAAKVESSDPLDMIEVFKIEIPSDSKSTETKRYKLDLPPLHSAHDVLERRKSGAELPLAQSGKSNKVLSDTIQKLSSQITQGPTQIPLPTFQPEERSDSSDSDDSERRLIIDKLSEEDTASGSSSSDAGRAGLATRGRAGRAGRAAVLPDKTASPVEWSAGESLLMLEDFCKADRASHQGRTHALISKPSEEDSNISLLLCEETIPGSPAPEGCSADAPAPARPRSMQMPFASAPSNSPEEGSSGKSGRRSDERDSKGDRDRQEQWDRELEERAPPLDNTPPTTPDSSPDASPRRDRRMSEQDSMGGALGDDDALSTDKPHQPAKLFSGRCRKGSEGSAGASAVRRVRRSHRDSDDRPPAGAAPPLKYNFYVELDPSWDSNTRINMLMGRLTDLRRAYHSVKAELAAIDRRRKKLRRKEREAVKAAKAACS